MHLFLAALALLYCSLIVHSQECSSDDPQVLILGGGMTGVAAANKLAELGITDFVILEAQDRLGGRMRTAELAPGVNVNVGANWIQGVDPAEPRLHPIFDLAERCGGLNGFYSDYDDITIYNSQGVEVGDSSLRYDDYEAAVEQAIEISLSAQSNGHDDTNVREGLTQAGWIPNSPEDNFVEWFDFDFCFAESPNVTSLFLGIDIPTFSDFLADPGNDAEDYYITDNRGYPALIECLADNFSTNPSSDSHIHTETLVTQIKYSDDCVCATATENGEVSQYCAPYAIVTFSVGVLRQQSSMLFSPPLPEAKMNALDFIVMAFYSIIYAEFSERFWDNCEYIGHVHPDRGYFPVIQIVPQSRGVNATAMHVTDSLAFRLAELSEDALKAEVTQVFRSIYGDSVPEPNRILSMPWGTDPLFLGSYSNHRPGGKGMAEELVMPEGRMYLAGEGTHTEYSGYVHGAFLSGIDTANTVQQRISSGSKLMANAVVIFIIATCKLL